jgi:predicted ATPase
MRADKTRRQPALYGRDSELRSLWDGFRRATAGRLQFVTVAGPAGIGKSSLINKFLHELPVTAPVAYGRTTPQQHFIPYRALSNSLLHVLQDLYGATLDGDVSLLSQIKYAFKSCGGIAADALPGGAGILGRCEDSRVAVSAKEKHFRQAFLTVVSAIPTGDYPLVLVLEDLHWADSASLLLLEYIFANCFHARVLLIVSYRNGSPSIPLKTFLAAAVHFAVQHEALLVLPLTHDQLVHFVTDRLGATIDASKHLAALIMGQTQGNPFAIESCLRRLNDAKTATSDLNETGLAVYPEEPLKAPEHYWRAVVADASKSLSQVLYALACIGRVAEPRLLADVLSLPRSKILLLCAEAEYVGLLVQDGPAWRFAHDIIAQIAYEKLCSVNGVEEMHCRIGIAMHLIVDSARDVVNFEVVTQLNKGASASIGALGADQIFLLNVAAGRKAKETWAYAPAEHYFSMAHQLSAQLNPIPAAVFSEVCRNLGECAGLRSSFENVFTRKPCCTPPMRWNASPFKAAGPKFTARLIASKNLSLPA